MNNLYGLLLKKPLLLIPLFILLALIIYARIISAPPIWDDKFFLFEYGPFSSGLSFAEIWQNYAWPMTATIYKSTLALFGNKYIYYHLLNIILHSFNGYLVYHILKKLDLPFALVTALLFLVHPANLITVAWMVQIKTIVAFTFVALATIQYIKWFKEKKMWQFASFLLLFILSMTTKSTAIFLPVVLLLIHLVYKQMNKKIILGGLFFLSLSLFAGIKLIKSPAVEKHNMNQSRMTQSQDLSDTLISKVDFTTQATWYYLQQAFIPYDIAPVKGVFYQEPLTKVLGLLFFIISFVMLLFLFEKNLGIAIVCALILMIPFLGIIHAPFMKVTSVSDQHLYLVLPILLWIMVFVSESLINIPARLSSEQKKSYSAIFFTFVFSYFSFTTMINNKTFESEENFYLTSLNSNPLTLAFYVNLSSLYVEMGNIPAAIQIIERGFDVCNENPELQKTDLYAHLGYKWFELEQLNRAKQVK